jgi:serine/threonine-protein kinase
MLVLARDNFLRLTSTPGDNLPVWSPDGRHIAYQNSQTGLFWVRSDASSPPEHLLKSEHPVYPRSFSPDGKRLAYSETYPETGADIWTLPIEGIDSDHPIAGKPEAFLRTAANEFDPAFSPDGRWMAYTSDESGNLEVYVRPFPGPAAKWQISSASGRIPVWSKSGRELAYETLDGRLMMVSYVVTGDTLTPGKPRLWSDQTLYVGNSMDLAPDGKRFAVLMAQQPSNGPSSPGGVSLLLNFFDDLKQRVRPAGR